MAFQKEFTALCKSSCTSDILHCISVLKQNLGQILTSRRRIWCYACVLEQLKWCLATLDHLTISLDWSYISSDSGISLFSFPFCNRCDQLLFVSKKFNLFIATFYNKTTFFFFFFCLLYMCSLDIGLKKGITQIRETTKIVP